MEDIIGASTIRRLTSGRMMRNGEGGNVMKIVTQLLIGRRESLVEQNGMLAEQVIELSERIQKKNEMMEKNIAEMKEIDETISLLSPPGQ
jgi:hypothetical protein